MDACSLLAAADMEAALGEPFHDGTSAPTNQPSVCTYTSKDGVGRNVSVVIYEQGGAAMLPMMMPQPTDVPGIGDRAIGKESRPWTEETCRVSVAPWARTW